MDKPTTRLYREHERNPEAIYSTMVAYLLVNGWRREEIGSGWWRKDEAPSDLGMGDAVEWQLRADGIDLRIALVGEPEEFWG